MAEWQVFQRDVLDLLRQYEGFFDFFERIGSLSDNSRPDCVARVSRKDKKEVWIVDAKNKPELDPGDQERMEKYVENVKSNPIDIGLELSEASEYEFRGIFVTNRGELSPARFEQVSFPALHQFLQRELVYTQTGKVVRDVAKMAKRKELSQSQARLLYRSLKPFEERLEHVLEQLREIETRYIGMELLEPPLQDFDSAPVDAVLRHGPRDKVFLIDVPYSRDELERIDEKVEEVKKSMSGLEGELYYAAVDTFDGEEREHVYPVEKLDSEIRETAGIVSPDDVAELFAPKISYQKTYEDSYLELKDSETGFLLRVESTDDIEHTVEVKIPVEAVKRIKDNMMNARKNFGMLEDDRFQQRLEVTESNTVKYGDHEEKWRNFRDSVNSIYSSAVNPVLSKKIKKTV
ncbi:MAG: hypothetical protein ABEJ75_02410 [Candidatus Nanohaloarchaea archaeon]